MSNKKKKLATSSYCMPYGDGHVVVQTMGTAEPAGLTFNGVPLEKIEGPAKGEKIYTFDIKI